MNPLLLLLAALLGFLNFSHASEQPNIILILVDDMGWGDLSSPEQTDPNLPGIKTPHLARLSHEGILLQRHYTAAPVCAPARASLFSGVHQGHAEVVRNNSFDAALENSHTLASVLKAAGYRTALIGKWGIGGGQEGGGTPATASAWPTKRGFDYFFGYHNHIAGHRHYPYEESNMDPENNCNAIWDGEEIITPQLAGCYSTDLFTARAKKWIIDHRKEQKDRPFFLALTLIAPHARLAVPSGPYPPGGGVDGGVQWMGEPGNMINTANPAAWDSFIYPEYREKWEEYAKAQYPGAALKKLEAARRHATMVTRIDEAVGDITKLCNDLGIREKTLIIFTSDNGPHDEPGSVKPIAGHPAPTQDPSFFRSYGPLDGIKRDTWDGGLRVPCIVSMPGTVVQNAASQTPSQFHDWMATMADLAGIPRPMRCDGVSLMPTLTGRTDQQETGVVYSEYAFSGAMPMYRGFADNKKGRTRGEQQVIFFHTPEGKCLKAIRSQIRTGREDFEIYDTLEDTHEAQDLSSQYSHLQDQLRTQALYHRRAYDYVRSADAGKRKSPCQGKRPYDGLLVPANTPGRTEKGLAMRRLTATCPWVPEFSTLPGAQELPASVARDPSREELPAGSVTEYKGYLRIPEDGHAWRFYLTLDNVPGSKAYIRMHQFQLIDADASYTPGTTANESAAANTVEQDPQRTGTKGVPLKAGLHEIHIVVVQGPSASGKLKLEWNRGPQGKETPQELIPAQAYEHLPLPQFSDSCPPGESLLNPLPSLGL